MCFHSPNCLRNAWSLFRLSDLKKKLSSMHTNMQFSRDGNKSCLIFWTSLRSIDVKKCRIEKYENCNCNCSAWKINLIKLPDELLIRTRGWSWLWCSWDLNLPFESFFQFKDVVQNFIIGYRLTTCDRDHSSDVTRPSVAVVGDTFFQDYRWSHSQSGIKMKAD